MRDALLRTWEKVHTSFWFVPTAMATGAVLLSVVSINLDHATGNSFADSIGFIWSGGAQGARSLLSTIAGSMITVAGTVFSITIVALTLASSQFGPRLLRNFVRDTGNQITLGTFTATFLYCILVLRTVRVQEEGNFVPYISITVGVALAIASLGVLIFFIHHVSVSIQAENLIAKVGEGLCEAVDRHFPACPQEGTTADPVRHKGFDELLRVSECTAVHALRSGYLQTIDRDRLIKIAEEADLQTVVRFSPGDFVLAGDVLMEVGFRHGKPPGVRVCQRLQDAFSLGAQRTEEQDVRYGARQLAEIASRALSPGINDPYTAMGCIDWITNALARALQREPPPSYLADSQGNLRVRECLPGLGSLSTASWEAIIAYGLDSPLVARHTSSALSRLSIHAQRKADILTLHDVTTSVIAQVHQLLKEDESRQRVLSDLAALQKRLRLS